MFTVGTAEENEYFGAALGIEAADRGWASAQSVGRLSINSAYGIGRSIRRDSRIMSCQLA